MGWMVSGFFLMLQSINEVMRLGSVSGLGIQYGEGWVMHRYDFI